MSEFNCSTCRQKFNTFMWCDSCQKQEFENNFKNWTSENDEIDSFIQQTQLKAIDFDQFIQWMPFEGFDILGKVGQGGFATVYEAIWCDGPIWNWNVKSRKWERNDSCRVALKVLEDSKAHELFLFDNYGELDVKDEKLFKFGHEYELHPGAVYISRDLSIYAQYLSQDEVVEIEWSKGKKLEVYER
ncbi:674_t:CDS:2 [Funneliformis caledonium]|uniref:674_t:CDS:1 n=1 Tax=Funneliformis caledonium TaxID=1117310 RepID=A0A9N8V3H7_9GLOM|nr:674_t:CDS:2 [Funneliformis caledonium]